MHRRLFAAVLFVFTVTLAADAQDGPKNAVVLIIRHGEKPAGGVELSPLGEERAQAYKHYFQDFTVDSQRLCPNVVFAAKDSKDSNRPRLTVEPFAKAEKLPVDAHFSSGHTEKLAAALRANDQGKRILISWHHTDIPSLLRALGAEPESLLPRGKWPNSVFGWVLMLSFDQDGHLIPAGTKRIEEHLMPDDSP
jgi:hypothetical protein